MRNAHTNDRGWTPVSSLTSPTSTPTNDLRITANKVRHIAIDVAGEAGGKTVREALAGDNCGTGAGGFKPGNTCASGKSGKITSSAERLLRIRLNQDPDDIRVRANLVKFLEDAGDKEEAGKVKKQGEQLKRLAGLTKKLDEASLSEGARTKAKMEENKQVITGLQKELATSQKSIQAAEAKVLGIRERDALMKMQILAPLRAKLAITRKGKGKLNQQVEAMLYGPKGEKYRKKYEKYIAKNPKPHQQVHAQLQQAMGELKAVQEVHDEKLKKIKEAQGYTPGPSEEYTHAVREHKKLLNKVLGVEEEAGPDKGYDPENVEHRIKRLERLVGSIKAKSPTSNRGWVPVNNSAIHTDSLYVTPISNRTPTRIPTLIPTYNSGGDKEC